MASFFDLSRELRDDVYEYAFCNLEGGACGAVNVISRVDHGIKQKYYTGCHQRAGSLLPPPVRSPYSHKATTSSDSPVHGMLVSKQFLREAVECYFRKQSMSFRDWHTMRRVLENSTSVRSNVRHITFSQPWDGLELGFSFLLACQKLLSFELLIPCHFFPVRSDKMANFVRLTNEDFDQVPCLHAIILETPFASIIFGTDPKLYLGNPPKLWFENLEGMENYVHQQQRRRQQDSTACLESPTEARSQPAAQPRVGLDVKCDALPNREAQAKDQSQAEIQSKAPPIQNATLPMHEDEAESQQAVPSTASITWTALPTREVQTTDLMHPGKRPSKKTTPIKRAIRAVIASPPIKRLLRVGLHHGSKRFLKRSRAL